MFTIIEAKKIFLKPATPNLVHMCSQVRYNKALEQLPRIACELTGPM